MMEKIDNFAKIIEDYYNKDGKNYEFHFIPVRVKYKYIRYYEPNETSYILEYVPVLTKKGSQHDEDIFKIGIIKSIDSDGKSGSGDFHRTIVDLVPKKYKVISNNELNKIASLNGYKEFTWDIHNPYWEEKRRTWSWYFSDNHDGDYYLKDIKDYWVYDVYGVPLEDTKNIDLSFLTDEQLFGDEALDVIKTCGTKCEVTDFADYSGIFFKTGSDDGKRILAPYLIRSTHMLPHISNPLCVDWDGERKIVMYDYMFCDGIDIADFGIRPSVSYSSIKSMAYDEKINSLGIKEIYFGEYPQSEVDEKYANELENAYMSGKTRFTGRYYTTSSRIHEHASELDHTNVFVDFEPASYQEIEYNGARYIRIKTNYAERIVWLAVEPLKWLVDEKKDIAIADKVFLGGIPYYNRETHKTDFYQTVAKQFLDKYVSKEIIQNNQKNDFDIANSSSSKQATNVFQFNEPLEIDCEIDFNDIKLSMLSYNQLFGPDTLDIIKQYGPESEQTDLIDAYNCDYWLKTPYSCNGTIRFATTDGICGLCENRHYQSAVRPIFDCSKILSGIGANSGVKQIIFGEYPQKLASEKMQKKLNKLYDKGKINKTGRSYTLVKYDKLVTYDEYVYKNERYIRLEEKNYDSSFSHCKWIKVMPVEWLIDEKTKLAIAKKILVDGISYYGDVDWDFEKTYDGNFEASHIYKYLNEYMLHDLFQGKQSTIKADTTVEKPKYDVEPLKDEEKDTKEKTHRSLLSSLRALKSRVSDLNSTKDKKASAKKKRPKVAKPPELESIEALLLELPKECEKRFNFVCRLKWLEDYYNNYHKNIHKGKGKHGFDRMMNYNITKDKLVEDVEAELAKIKQETQLQKKI